MSEVMGNLQHCPNHCAELKITVVGYMEQGISQILEAEDGTEAIRTIENNSGEIALVVSDIMMPKMNGLELREKAILLRPEMRFLLISGYMEDTTRQTEHLPQDAGYLEKPFLPIELARKVRRPLNESDAGRGCTGKTA